MPRCVSIWTTSRNPDVLLRIEPQAGGQSRVGDDDYLEGAPELIVEIAASSAAYDLHDKLRVYRRNGVREYVVWRVHDRQLDWFALEDDEYPAGSHPTRREFSTAPSFPGCGSPSRRCWPATSQLC